MNIVLLGSPASGKGTQAELLCREFGLYHLSTGDLSRKLAEKDGRIKEMIDSGKLIPEQEMTMHVLDFLLHEKPDLKNILFEGFPRFISQYEALDEYLKNKGDDIDLVISLDLSEEAAIKRLSSRRICENCGATFNLETNPPAKEGICDKCGSKLIQRKDDNPESIKTRFEYYQNNTKELIDYLDRKGKLVRVDGDRPIEEIAEDIKERVNSLNGKN